VIRGLLKGKRIMSTHHFTTRKLADIEVLLPGFKAVWGKMKSECGTSQRCPKSVSFTDTPSGVHPNDYDCAKRFALNLVDMKLSSSVHISAGEWAVHAGPNNDGAVSAVPENMALITCLYNDYYRSFSMYVQVKKIPQQIAPTGL
jgi:hypothetical protein